jgi:hypothetical protein
MAAHLRSIHEPKCGRCGRKATVTLHSTRNAPIGDYCQKHGATELKEFLRKYPEEGGPQ